MKYVKHALSTTTRKQESRELSIQDNDYKHLMSTYFSCTQRAAQITSSVRSTSFQRQAKFKSITREIVQIQTFLSLMSIFCWKIGTVEQTFQFAQIILSRGIVIKVLSQEILWKYKSELRCELKTFKIQLHNIKDSRFLGCSAKLSNW